MITELAPPPPRAPVRPSVTAADSAARPSRFPRVPPFPFVAVTSLALFFNTWGLAHNGLGNEYYTAATRSMASSWQNWFFAAFDKGGFISVDKPPVPLWITALSVRAFGVSTWSVLLPSAIAGTAAVALLFFIVRRHFGVVAATIAGLVLAISPVNVAVNRLNIPEPWLVLFLVGAAWALLRSLESKHWVRWTLLAGSLVGLAFNTKMFAAFIPLSALALALMVGPQGWVDRIRRAALFGAVAIATSLPWIIIVDLVPASSRPYVGGSTNNTVWNLVFGYNGFGRIDGQNGRGAGVGGAMSAAGGIFGGTAGPLRLLSDAVGGQIAWLLPLAAVGTGAAVWCHRRHRGRLAAIVLWAGWLALYVIVFSRAKGTFHSYYVSVIMPAIAALVGIGLASLVVLMRRQIAWLAVAFGAVAATVALEVQLSNREPNFYHWSIAVMFAALVVAGIVAATALVWQRSRAWFAAGVVTLAALTLTPALWAGSETANAVMNATLPQAGPRSGAASTSFGSSSWWGDAALAAFLRGHHTTETWDLVVANAQEASGLMADDGINVMALGGFMGTDSTTNFATIAKLVDEGRVRYFSVSGGGRSGFGGGASTSILNVVAQACTAVNVSSSSNSATSGTVYDCAGKGDLLTAAG